MVAHLDRTHLQNVPGFLEPREPRTKHHPDSARSGLAPEMDRLAPHCLRHLHALLLERFSATGRFGSSSPIAICARKARTSSRSLGNLTSACESRSRSHYRRPPFFLYFWKEEIRYAGARQTN